MLHFTYNRFRWAAAEFGQLDTHTAATNHCWFFDSPKVNTQLQIYSHFLLELPANVAVTKSRRDRCDCAPTEEDAKRCFILPFDRCVSSAARPARLCMELTSSTIQQQRHIS